MQTLKLIVLLIGLLHVPAPPRLPAPVMPRPFVVWGQVWVITYQYDDPIYLGHTYCPERRLMIILNQNCVAFRDTTFHELMHAATFCNLSRQDIHTTIWNLAPAIEEFTRLNPQAATCWRHTI